ncbi:mechanosensitive ion channel family protein [Pseudopedobacter beijingensis]|uniref:Mechanosensitive ion channel family protein n=1 Tax=Pseudopedobacter beijingensis TaxID=1207056 RepID=A0ABW4I938_9SPHI
MITSVKEKDFISTVHEWLENIIEKIGVENQIISYLKLFVFLVVLVLVVWITYRLGQKILIKVFKNLISKTSTKFDDFLLEHKLPDQIARIIPLNIVISLVPLIFYDFTQVIPAVNTLLDIYTIVLGIYIFRSVLRSIRDYLKTKDSFKDKPIDSYVQVMVIVLYFVAGLLIFTTLTGRSVLAFFTTLGAASAILILVFKDTILGFVASIQVTINDMVRIGDWITMDKYGADGDVIEISLTTVKVQNFDKTITTIPTYNLISDSFKNWRGMTSAGGRRIKRAIRIKISTIKYLSDEDIHRLKKVSLISDYLNTKKTEIEQNNSERNIDRSVLINGRNLTNIGVFRVYIDEYLKSNPNLHTGMTMIVRQLEPQDDGLPLEIYTFTNDVKWKNYENIMADIFDHIFAAVSYFDLEVFESPASSDFRSMLSKINA